jgi:hypothetical protein
MQEFPEGLPELEARLKELEASQNPDFGAIAELHDRIEAMKAQGGGGGEAGSDYSGSSPGGLEQFDDWAADAGKRYEDPSSYGEGQRLNAGETPAAEPAPKAPPQEAPAQDKDGLTEDMEKVMKYIIDNVVIKSYEATTLKGKKKLPQLVKAAASGGGPNPLDRLNYSLKRGFDKVIQSLNYSEEEWQSIIYQLVLGLDDYVYSIEHQDQGAARILKSLIAREYLSSELYTRLDKKGAFN